MLEVIYVKGISLHCQFPGAAEPQECRVELDCARRTLTAACSPAFAGEVSRREWLGHTRTWTIPALKAAACNRLLMSIVPHATVIADAYRSVWNGKEYRAEFSGDNDVDLADETIEVACRDTSDDDLLVIWNAMQWVETIGTYEQQAFDFGINADSTDVELEDLASSLFRAAQHDHVDYIVGLLPHLHRIRSAMRDLNVTAAE